MIEPFVLVGKARQVFELIALKTRIAQEAEAREKRLLGAKCPYSNQARCNKPDNKSCAEINCPVWMEAEFGGKQK